jgi:hypothetical protein
MKGAGRVRIPLAFAVNNAVNTLLQKVCSFCYMQAFGMDSSSVA